MDGNQEDRFVIDWLEVAIKMEHVKIVFCSLRFGLKSVLKFVLKLVLNNRIHTIYNLINLTQSTLKNFIPASTPISSHSSNINY